MTFEIVHLGDILKAFDNDEKKCLELVANFYCPLDGDIEHFLKNKAIINQKMGLSRTYLVYTSFKRKKVLVGYFAIAFKPLVVRSKVSKTLKKKITGFKDKQINEVPAFLIGQLAKNYFNDYNKIMTGEQLLELAINKILEANRLIGGRAIMVECADNAYLKKFYEDKGFFFIEKDEKDKLLKYVFLINGIDK